MEQDLKQRIDLMKECSLIDEDGYSDLCKVEERFWNDYKIQMTEENAGVMVTHLGAAFKRMKTGEKVEPLDEFVFEGVKKSVHYEDARNIWGKIKVDLMNELSENEEQFVIAHICNLLGKEGN